MGDPYDLDPAHEDEEQWQERVVNDAVAGEHVPTDEELDLESAEHEGMGVLEDEDLDADIDEVGLGRRRPARETGGPS
jgi:hypothetical protein